MTEPLAEFSVPYIPPASLSSNSRANWRTKHRATREVYTIVRAQVLWQRVATITEPVEIEVEFVWPTSQRGRLTDVGNQQHLAKAVIDALRRCSCAYCRKLRPRPAKDGCDAGWWMGILPDDDTRWVKAVRVTASKGDSGPRTTVRILAAVAAQEHEKGAVHRNVPPLP